MKEITTGRVFERAGATLLARARNHTGLNVTRATLAAIHYEVWEIETEPPIQITPTTPLVVNNVVFDSPIVDALWTVDAVGYNFRLELPASSFPYDRMCRVDVRFTPTTGEVFRAAFEVDALRVYGA